MKKEILEKDIESLKSPEGYLYACLPKFRGLFGRDSLIAGWELLGYDSTFAKNSLIALAELQGKTVNSKNGEEPGKILHEFYSNNVARDWFKREKGDSSWLKLAHPFYFSVDSTPLFLIVFDKYYERTKDDALVKKLLPNIEAAIKWILNYGLIKGFVRYNGRDKSSGLVSQSWKDGIGSSLENQKGPVAVVEVQGYAYEALKRGAKLLRLFGREINRDIKELTRDFSQKFNRTFWVEEEQFYCLAIDGNNNQIKFVTSNPGQLLFTGIIDKKRADLIVKRLFQDDLWTPYGIRTDSTKETDFDPLSYQRGSVWPHDNWLIAEGLKKRGYRKEYNLVKKALFRAYQEIGFIPEYYGVSLANKIVTDGLETPPCYPQAWSSGALVDFLETGKRALFSKMIKRSKEILRTKNPIRA